VNFLSHLLLNELFIKNLNDGHRIKIISVTSPVYRYARPRFIIPERRNYAAFKAYTESKYYLLMLGHFFKEKYPEKNIDFIGFNPGTFSSGIYRMQGGFFKTLYHIAAPFMRSSKSVARNFVNVIRNENLVSGRIYRSVNKSVDFKDPNKSESVKFLYHCSGIISDYLHI